MNAIIKKALETTFSAQKMMIFDYSFYEKPKSPLDKDLALFWGGYCLEFKVIMQQKYEELGQNLEQIRKQAIPILTSGSPKMKVELSKFEDIEKTQVREIDGYAVQVYSPELILCEKMRAICQQMPEYLDIVKSQKPTERPRDFFDIFHVARQWNLDFRNEESRKTLKQVFSAKKVPLTLLFKIGTEDTFDFHERAFSELESVVDRNHRLESFLFTLISQKILSLH